MMIVIMKRITGFTILIGTTTTIGTMARIEHIATGTPERTTAATIGITGSYTRRSSELTGLTVMIMITIMTTTTKHSGAPGAIARRTRTCLNHVGRGRPDAPGLS